MLSNKNRKDWIYNKNQLCSEVKNKDIGSALVAIVPEEVCWSLLLLFGSLGFFRIPFWTGKLLEKQKINFFFKSIKTTGLSGWRGLWVNEGKHIRTIIVIVLRPVNKWWWKKKSLQMLLHVTNNNCLVITHSKS